MSLQLSSYELVANKKSLLASNLSVKDAMEKLAEFCALESDDALADMLTEVHCGYQNNFIYVKRGDDYVAVYKVEKMREKRQ